MARTIRIPDVDDDVYAGLQRRAADQGVTVPELLREAAARLAVRPLMSQWLASTSQRRSEVSTPEVLAALDEWRGEWPNAGR